MRLAFVTQYPENPAAPHGGVEAVSVTLVDALAQFDDLEIHVVTVDRGRREPATLVSGRVTIHRLPYLGGSVLSNAIGAGRKQIHEYVRRLAPDVVHAHDTYGLMTVGLDVPRVFTVHGFIHGDTLVSGQRFAWLRSHLWRHYEVAGWADQPSIVSISPYVRERLSRVTRSRIYDIDNPIADSFFKIQPTNPQRPVVFSAALIEPRKNTIALVDAFARLLEAGVDAELRLAGRVSNERYGDELTKRIATLGVGDKVKLLGSLPSPRIREELSVAAVYALVSLEENSPIGIEEAMAAGVPVVTSNRCGMPYMVRHGESGFLVNSCDTEEICRRLKTILTDAALRSAMGEAGKRIALDRFHATVVARRTREVYRDAVESFRGGEQAIAAKGM